MVDEDISTQNCPSSRWTDSTECSNGKEFMRECHQDAEAMMKYLKSLLPE